MCHYAGLSMLKKLSLWLFITLGFALLTVKASPVETFEFKDEVTKVRFQALTKELRCPKCQNQNLADSNSPIAADLRKQVYQQLQQGKADSEIVDYMVARYGEFVLYRPRVSTLTYVLWFGPALILLLGAMVVVFILRSKAQNNNEIAQDLSAEQQEKLASILKKTSSTHSSTTKENL
jgi:cytochrome c-type biogenesis protein CcmH